ncbi:hypothetical protein Y601_5969 [Burkholderia pseudomallei MSHR640]|nr:hypothetical protein Y601_5969 [Burkholderia pseudomallei MSHR640]
MANRPGDRPVPIPRDLPGVVIFIHGVNDPGAAYATVERGLCQGLNERLSRSDLRTGEYGRRYAAASAAKAEGDSVRYAEVLGDPDMYLYRRAETGGTHSMFLPFYWGYRASDDEIAKISHPGEVKSRVADSDGNLMTRGQYQDIHGNRLDAHFGKGGGFFANATNNIPQMYSPGFEPDKLERTVMQNALGRQYRSSPASRPIVAISCWPRLAWRASSGPFGPSGPPRSRWSTAWILDTKRSP